MTADDTAPLSRGPEGDGWWRRLLRDTGYTLTAFPIALVAFVVAVVGLSLGAATLVIGVGFCWCWPAPLSCCAASPTSSGSGCASVRGRTSPVPSYAVARAGDSGGPPDVHAIGRCPVVARRQTGDLGPVTVTTFFVVSSRGGSATARRSDVHALGAWIPPPTGRLGSGAARVRRGTQRRDRVYLGVVFAALPVHPARGGAPAAGLHASLARAAEQPRRAPAGVGHRPDGRDAAGSPRRPRCAGWSATSTTVRSSGWSGSRGPRPGPHSWTRTPAGRRHGRRGARADPGDAGRAAYPLPRHRPADPDRPGPGRRAAEALARADRPVTPRRPGPLPPHASRPPTSWSPRP